MLYFENNFYKLFKGKMQDELKNITADSIDSIVTDPPYCLTSIKERWGKTNNLGVSEGTQFGRVSKGFMGKEWDNEVAMQSETWKECFRVLKPGGYLLAFGGTRTFHRIACAIEDAGFEIRDTIMWLYGSGFPKNLNLGKVIDKKEGNERIKTGKIIHHAQKGVAIAEERGAVGGGSFGIARDEEETIGTSKWEGWGTALKPAYEPIIVARKPVEKSVTDNVLKYGVGGINIDECRVSAKQGEYDIRHYTNEDCFQNLKSKKSKFQVKPQPDGRFPANVILTYDDTDFDEVCGGFPEGKQNGSISKPYKINNQVYGDYGYCKTFDAYNDSGSASRYFYCAKASKKDRDEGLDNFKEKIECDRNEECYSANVPFNRSSLPKRNTHPTVKPTELMQYLIRLVTPKNGIILDPFMGSGSTGKAVMFENRERDANYKFIGIEMTDEYLPIAKARIDWANTYQYNDNDNINQYKERTLF